MYDGKYSREKNKLKHHDEERKTKINNIVNNYYKD